MATPLDFHIFNMIYLERFLEIEIVAVAASLSPLRNKPNQNE
jgi:hypothetical protein